MLSKKNNPVPVFSVRKKHSPKERLFKFFEISLIFVVIIGTAIWLALNSQATIKNFISGVFGGIKPQVTSEPKEEKLTVEQEITSLLSGVAQVESVTKNPDGFLEVKTKDNISLLFSQDKNLADQVRTLQTVTAKAKIDKRALKKVDFRFAKIVVEYF